VNCDIEYENKYQRGEVTWNERYICFKLSHNKHMV
jgi:hypothetical protein